MTQTPQRPTDPTLTPNAPTRAPNTAATPPTTTRIQPADDSAKIRRLAERDGGEVTVPVVADLLKIPAPTAKARIKAAGFLPRNPNARPIRYYLPAGAPTKGSAPAAATKATTTPAPVAAPKTTSAPPSPTAPTAHQVAAAKVASGGAPGGVVVKTLRLDEVQVDPGIQQREGGASPDVVDEYAEQMRLGITFPPVVVYWDGQRYWLADGFTRHAARAKAEKGEIAAEVHQGDRRAAILHAVGANHQHGARRTNADKHRAVRTVLADPVWRKESAHWIADRCHVTQPFVSKIIKELADNGYQTERTGQASTAAGSRQSATAPARSATPPSPAVTKAPIAPKTKTATTPKATPVELGAAAVAPTASALLPPSGQAVGWTARLKAVQDQIHALAQSVAVLAQQPDFAEADKALSADEKSRLLHVLNKLTDVQDALEPLREAVTPPAAR